MELKGMGHVHLYMEESLGVVDDAEAIDRFYERVEGWMPRILYERGGHRIGFVLMREQVVSGPSRVGVFRLDSIIDMVDGFVRSEAKEVDKRFAASIGQDFTRLLLEALHPLAVVTIGRADFAVALKYSVTRGSAPKTTRVIFSAEGRDVRVVSQEPARSPFRSAIVNLLEPLEKDHPMREKVDAVSIDIDDLGHVVSSAMDGAQN